MNQSMSDTNGNMATLTNVPLTSQLVEIATVDDNGAQGESVLIGHVQCNEQPHSHSLNVYQLSGVCTDGTTVVCQMSGSSEGTSVTPIPEGVVNYNGGVVPITEGTTCVLQPGDKLHNVDCQDTCASGDVGKGSAVETRPDDSLEAAEAPEGMTSLLSKPVKVNGTYHCEHCSYKTDKKANWYKHKNRHSGRRQYVCELCPYRATTSSNLNRHKLIHDDVKGFTCPLCQLKFRQKIHLERHTMYKHREKGIRCDHCDYRCTSYNPDMKVHLWRKHMICDSDQQPELLKCDECSFSTVLRRELRQHVKFHRRGGPELKLYCSECCFVTDCSSRLQRHSLTHTRLRPFACSLCDYRATQKEHIVRHMQARHNVDVSTGRRKMRRADKTKSAHPDIRAKQFACTMCSMKFAKLINLYKHMHAQHGLSAEGGELACMVCDYLGTSHKSLLVHMRKHTVCELPRPRHIYSCAVCEFTHVERDKLHEHMHSEHQVQVVVSNGLVHCLVDYEQQEADETAQLSEVIADSTSSEVAEEDVKLLDVDQMTSLTDIVKALEVPTLCAAEAHSNVTEDVTKLSSGDIVEINGEMYRVELATSVKYE